MENSNIEWTHHTFNPWIGCTKVSPGCANCYAEKLMDMRYGRVKWGKGEPRLLTGRDNWRKPKQWNRAATITGERPRVFCASLADWLDDEVPIDWLVDLLTLIYDTPQLDWLLLTKRPQNWRKRISAAALIMSGAAEQWASNWLFPIGDVGAPHNVWIGTTVEDQARAEERIPIVLTIPARVRFLSCEPMVGPVGGLHWLPGEAYTDSLGVVHRRAVSAWSGVHWVICGGESGHNPRPMNPEWALSLRDQCNAAAVAFHFKQWGGTDKKAAGRVLDGRTWDELPSVSNAKAERP